MFRIFCDRIFLYFTNNLCCHRFERNTTNSFLVILCSVMFYFFVCIILLCMNKGDHDVLEQFYRCPPPRGYAGPSTMTTRMTSVCVILHSSGVTSRRGAY